MANKAIFFDRDGTLNVDTNYLYRPEDFRWIDGAIDAVKCCNDHGYLAIIITNQSGVARGRFTEADVLRLHEWMNAQLAPHGAHLDALYYCPHHPKGEVLQYRAVCECRKPAPGMILKACEDFQIDKDASLMIGDKPRDVECAENAGVRGWLFKGGNVHDLVKKFILGTAAQ